jgi:hypothetical protein
MHDHTASAEAFFRDFAARHSFAIERIENCNIELLMRIPKQWGLSFELTLGLQNVDELNIGFGEFWSYFFPFTEERKLVATILEAIALGDCRLATHRQFGVVVKRVLALRSSGSWRAMYTAFSRPQLPIVGTRISYLCNDDARSLR